MKGPTECQQSPGRENKSTSKDDADFSEYLWMAEELEEFDRKVEIEYWEEVFIEACFEEMWEEEDEEWFYPGNKEEDAQNIHEFYQNKLNEVAKSTLNPLAHEFYPRDYEYSPEMEVDDEVHELR